MNRLNTVLGVVALAQGGLVALTWWPNNNAAAAMVPLVSLEPSDVHGLKVWTGTDKDKDPIELEQSQGAWQIKSSGGYPADATKVQKVLDALAGAEVSDPVATTKSSYDALKVTADSFDKKVELDGDGTSTTIFVGAGSGRAATVRREDADAVYRIAGLSQWSIGSRPSDYYDSTYLKVDPGDIQTFTVQHGPDKIEIQNTEGTWTIAGLAEGRTVDQGAVADLVRQATTVKISALPDDPTAPPTADLTVAWTVGSGDDSTSGGYVLGPETNSKRAVRSNDSSYTVLASTYSLKKVADASLETLTHSQ
ncbi:MAG: DUF4340 domain-containing protein [Oligoflexia bacterium]|nr:DUF4340 domain-containing protein [Oligoflexia bacterium]